MLYINDQRLSFSLHLRYYTIFAAAWVVLIGSTLLAVKYGLHLGKDFGTNQEQSNSGAFWGSLVFSFVEGCIASCLKLWMPDISLGSPNKHSPQRVSIRHICVFMQLQAIVVIVLSAAGFCYLYAL